MIRVGVPFYWAIAPTTTRPSVRASQQTGVLFQGEFRQRLERRLSVRAYGIDQLDRGAFAGQPRRSPVRGGVETKGSSR